MTGAEKIMPYDDRRNKGAQVKEMFDNIAPAYDFMNRAMTLGIDRLWRRKAVNIIARDCQDKNASDYRILDLATGTADLAIAMARKIGAAHVTGIDLSEGMINIGREKVDSSALSDRVDLVIGDCLDLPFADNTFDCITAAFGVRNFERLLDGYRQMLRVLRPGGMLAVLELSVPPSSLVRPFYHLYTRKIIPVAGRIASKDMSAYTYLPASIEAVPQRADMTRIILEAGFSEARYISLTMGVCTLYIAHK